MKTNPLLRNDRNIWLTVAAIFSGCALASSANAQLTISDSATAPTADILTSQLTDDTSDDLGPGQDGNRDYMNNNGTVGQTFTLGLGHSDIQCGRGWRANATVHRFK